MKKMVQSPGGARAGKRRQRGVYSECLRAHVGHFFRATIFFVSFIKNAEKNACINGKRGFFPSSLPKNGKIRFRSTVPSVRIFKKWHKKNGWRQIKCCRWGRRHRIGLYFMRRCWGHDCFLAITQNFLWKIVANFRTKYHPNIEGCKLAPNDPDTEIPVYRGLVPLQSYQKSQQPRSPTSLQKASSTKKRSRINK